MCGVSYNSFIRIEEHNDVDKIRHGLYGGPFESTLQDLGGNW